MELGKVWSIELSCDVESSYVFSRLENDIDRYDTLRFDRVINVWTGKRDKTNLYGSDFWGENAFNVSLYVKEYIEGTRSVFSNITFEHTKNRYNGHTYHISDTQTCPLLEEVFRSVSACIDIELGKTVNVKIKKLIHFKAPKAYDMFVNFDSGGIYSLVGAKIWR